MATPEAHPGDTEASSSRLPLLAGVVALAVVVLGAALWFLVLSGGDDTDDTTEVASETDTETGDEANTTDTDDDAQQAPEAATEEARTDLLLVSAAQPGVRLEPRTDAELIGVAYTLSLDESGTTDRLPGEFVDQAMGTTGQSGSSFGEPEQVETVDLVAPEGHEFVVARVDLTLTSPQSVARASVNVDGVKRSVDLSPGAHTIAFVAPDDADVLALDVQDDVTEQSLGLLDGERLEQVDVLYRSESSRRVAVNSSMVLAFSAELTPGREVSDHDLDLGFGSATLVWVPDQSGVWPRDSTPAGAPSNSDRAWLVLEMSRYQFVPDIGGWGNPRIPGTAIVLVLEDDSEVLTPLSNLTGQHPLIFEVPADFTEGRIEIRPGDGIPNDRGGTFNFGGATGSVDLRFQDPGQ